MFAYVPVIILGPGAIAMKKQTKKKFFFFFFFTKSLPQSILYWRPGRGNRKIIENTRL